MGRRGTKPKPTAIKIADGTYRKDRHGDPETEAKPPPGLPQKPYWMTEQSAEVWDQVFPILDGMGVLTTADGNTLARYCNTFVRWFRANKFLQENGERFETEHGPKSAPEVAIERNTSAELLKMEREFGMTPSARTGLHVTPKEKKGIATRQRG